MGATLPEPNGNDRIEVSRDTLRAELAQLELRLVDRFTRTLAEKADQRLVEQIITDVNSIKEHGSPVLITVMDAVARQGSKVESLEGWRNKVVGAFAFFVLAEPLATLLFVHYTK